MNDLVEKYLGENLAKDQKRWNKGLATKLKQMGIKNVGDLSAPEQKKFYAELSKEYKVKG